MPSQFTIEKVISRSGKDRAQVTVNFHGRSVTRHIINGVGRHPDDTIPALHTKLLKYIEENRQLTAHKKAAIERIAELKGKDPKDGDALLKVMRDVAIELITGRKKTDWLALAAKMQREVEVLQLALPTLEEALAQVRKEDPIMVRYI